MGFDTDAIHTHSFREFVRLALCVAVELVVGS
jgi:hypothetical protein